MRKRKQEERKRKKKRKEGTKKSDIWKSYSKNRHVECRIQSIIYSGDIIDICKFNCNRMSWLLKFRRFCCISHNIREFEYQKENNFKFFRQNKGTYKITEKKSLLLNCKAFMFFNILIKRKAIPFNQKGNKTKEKENTKQFKKPNLIFSRTNLNKMPRSIFISNR